MKRLFACYFFSALLTSIIVRGQQSSDEARKMQQKLTVIEEDTARVNTLAELGRFYTFSTPDTAASYAKQGLQLARQIGYQSGEANCLGILCLSLTFLGNYTDALG